ncbi:nuclear RNA export factor 3-like protein [Cricetulus griseus]|uniref:Nuclear RNA export factor 3-like protein n=1 Tax=Cricetulus griseus TaxID=10029 RepID=A0A061HUN5_CRIGR|nr:nuclear RNA export factor 3-like protein [Cricetulus griseus]
MPFLCALSVPKPGFLSGNSNGGKPGHKGEGSIFANAIDCDENGSYPSTDFRFCLGEMNTENPKLASIKIRSHFEYLITVCNLSSFPQFFSSRPHRFSSEEHSKDICDKVLKDLPWFHYEKMQAQFFVDNSSIAFELKNSSDKIWHESNNKISIFISPCDEPHSVTELKSEKMDQIKVKSAGEIVKGQDTDPEEIRADKSSLSTTVQDKSSNINSILDLFPKLLNLDGRESPKPSLCGLEDNNSLPSCKRSSFGSESVKTLVLQSLQQYCLIYDNGDRQGLLNAYHAEACFSLTVLFSSTDSSSHSQLKLLPRALHPALQQSQAMSWNHFTGWTTTAVSSFTPGNSLCEYFKYSRNMKVLKHPYMWRRLLKHKKM